MFENLSDRLERSFKILKGEGKITEINVAETLKDVRRALLDADVNYKVAKNFTDTVKAKAGQTVEDIATRLLGPGMSCYVEVYNNLDGKTTLKEGQAIKIPKLQLKKRR